SDCKRNISRPSAYIQNGDSTLGICDGFCNCKCCRSKNLSFNPRYQGFRPCQQFHPKKFLPPGDVSKGGAGKTLLDEALEFNTRIFVQLRNVLTRGFPNRNRKAR